MQKILIQHDYMVHFEILESLIINISRILNLQNSYSSNIQIFLNIVRTDQELKIWKNYSFIEYFDKQIKKQNNVKLLREQKINYDVFDLILHTDTENWDGLKTNPKHFYISHKTNIYNERTYFLCPFGRNDKWFYADKLPFYKNIQQKSKPPVFIVQGNFEKHRRQFELIWKLLKKQGPFVIRLVGRFQISQIIKRKFQNNLQVLENLEFIDFHKQFLDAVGILPMISPETNPQYFKDTLTSTVNYARAYQLHCICHYKFAEIYDLPSVTALTQYNENTIYDAIVNFINSL